MVRHFEIKYSTKRYHKSIKFIDTYEYALKQYAKVKWAKALWDITEGAELITSSGGTGHGGLVTSIHKLINQA
jgi:hypothetical protein